MNRTRTPYLAMEQISVPIPIPGEGQTMDIQVTVGGRTKLLRYRVEALRFRPQADADERFDQLRTFIRDYDDAWTLVQIGAPGGDTVPLTFRQRPPPESDGMQGDDAEPERFT